LSVVQTPPPETPAQTRQKSSCFFAGFPQSGETTSAVVRLAVLFVAPENEVTPGWVALTCGPYCTHLLFLPFGSPASASSAAMLSKVSAACSVTASGISCAGYVR
jgi:hypothetical protein